MQINNKLLVKGSFITGILGTVLFFIAKYYVIYALWFPSVALMFIGFFIFVIKKYESKPKYCLKPQRQKGLWQLS